MLGDSLSAGMGEGEGVPWPRQLEELAAIPVMNLSQAGATSQDGAAMARLALQFPGLVVVELGGNDLLGSRSVAQYESDMARTLQVLVEHQRGIAIVELPLIPGKNAWGVAQRRLAQQFGCQLIPKRHLVDVLAAPGATVDTLHLSHQGHRYMAVMIWKQIRERMPADEADVVAPAERSHSE